MNFDLRYAVRLSFYNNVSKSLMLCYILDTEGNLKLQI